MKLKCVLLSGVIGILPIFLVKSLAAEGCTVVPTCTELGYSQKAENCTGKYYLKCPFDNDNIYCGEDCSVYLLTVCDTNKGSVKICEDKCKYTACNTGWTLNNGNCIANVCSGFTLSVCPNNASCTSCLSGTTTKYKIAFCQNGWIQSGNTCIMKTCPLATPQSSVSKRCSKYYQDSTSQGTEPCYCCESCTTDYPVYNGGRCYSREEANSMGGDNAPCGM